MRLHIEYFDQNENFAGLLPREGIVEGTPSCVDSSHIWHLLRLDNPVFYESTEYSHFLLASRWEGHHIGEPEPTSVFILLVPSSFEQVADGFSHKQFLHVAWGMASVRT
jgi:hypothetical protein